METRPLLNNLIAIPSYSDGKIYESKLVDYLKDYIQTRLPWLSVTRQKVAKNRYNLFISDDFPTRLLVVDHLDTVRPNNLWKKNPFEPFEKDGRLYGLGSSDSKGNVAALLTAIEGLKTTKGLGILLYADEEYNFLGMKSFIKSKLAVKLNPEYIFSIDGSGLELGLGCRGLIEFQMKLQGTTGHSANPKGNPGVIFGFNYIINELQNYLSQFTDPILGQPTLNIARINAGNLLAMAKNDTPLFNSQGNMLPDYMQATIEIRTTNRNLNFTSVKAELNRLIKNQGLRLQNIQKTHDYGCFRTNPDKLNTIQQIIKGQMKKTDYLDLGKFGYLDTQMLSDIYPAAKIFSFGCGTNGQAHKPDEYVDTNNLEIGTKIYQKIIKGLV